MILACEVCGDNLGYFRGVVEKFVCEPCLEKALMKGTTPLPPPAPVAPPLAVAAPVFFRCPSCNRSREWHLPRPPWQGAVCRDCYAEELMRRDEARKARGGTDAS